MATPTFILPSAPTYTEGFVNGLNVYPDPTNFVANQVPFTRATTATRVNAAGLIELVPYNLLTWSQDFSNANWVKSNGPTITYNSAIAPNGTMTATGIQDTTGVSYKSVYQTISNISPNSTFTCSIYVKKEISEIAYGGISMYFSGGTIKAFYGIVNAVNGTVTITSSTITPTITVVDLGTYWRIICTATDTGSNTNLLFEYYPTLSTNGTTLGQGIGSVRTIWGAQLVEGTDALPYQLTETRLNRPRVDFSLGGCPNLLLEPQRTNLLTYSEQFDNASWAKDNVTLTQNVAISPSGVLNADLITATSGVIHDVYNTFSGGTTNTISLFVKKGTSQYVYLSTSYQATTSDYTCILVDLDNKTLINQSSGNVAFVSGNIVDMGNGWLRIICTTTAASATGMFLFAGISSTYVFNLSLFGRQVSATTQTAYFWGAQAEIGSYSTSYIPTTSASVTRNSDTFQLSNVFTNNMISSAGGTWFVDLSNNIAYIRDSVGGGVMLATILNTYNNSIIIYNDVSPQRLGVQLYENSSLLTTYRTTTNRTKVAIKWNGTTADIFANGVKVVSNISFTLTQLQHLSQPNNVDVPKYINSMALWNTPLTDDELEVITGEGFDTYALMASNYNYILQ